MYSSDSIIHIHASILLQVLFPFGELQNIEQSSLCYTEVLVSYLSYIFVAVVQLLSRI